MKEEKRTKQIRKAIKLIGWIEVSKRIRTPEDRAIFTKLGQEFTDAHTIKEDKVLKKHGIKF